MQRYERTDGVTSEPSGDRTVVLDTAGENLTTLNPSGSVAWGALEEPRTLDEIVEALQRAYPDVPSEALHRDGRAFLDELLATGLIVASHARG